ncbi:hypothetical protein [Micromonospora sp. ATA51]|nr:hypothetical protein [Micromonospora sp. ATA51]
MRRADLRGGATTRSTYGSSRTVASAPDTATTSRTPAPRTRARAAWFGT